MEDANRLNTFCKQLLLLHYSPQLFVSPAIIYHAIRSFLRDINHLLRCQLHDFRHLECQRGMNGLLLHNIFFFIVSILRRAETILQLEGLRQSCWRFVADIERNGFNRQRRIAQQLGRRFYTQTRHEGDRRLVRDGLEYATEMKW